MEWHNPGFARAGCHNPRERGCANLLFGKIFAENCMKLKEVGPRGGVFPSDPLGSVTATSLL